MNSLILLSLNYIFPTKSIIIQNDIECSYTTFLHFIEAAGEFVIQSPFLNIIQIPFQKKRKRKEQRAV